MKGLAGEERRTVLLPAHTCASLPSAILRAGLTPVPVRLEEASLDYHEPSLVTALDRHRPLAVLAVNLFGMPGRSPRWAALAREAGASFIDDAAQTLGAGCAGRPSGRWGDAGFYSLARGKNITAMGGGILITNRDDLAEAVRDQARHHLAAPSPKQELRTLTEAAAFTALLHPRCYWLAPHLPGVRLQVFEIDTNFPARQMGGVQAALACRSWRRLAEANATHRRNGGRLRAALAGVHGIRIPTPAAGPAVWLRLPLLFDDPAARDRAAATLTSAGLGASITYPKAWYHLPGCPPPPEEPPPAWDLAPRLLTLATHGYVGRRDAARAVRLIVREAQR